MVHAPGRLREGVLIGGHIDSVPNGGWLDGCLNGWRARRCCAASAGAGPPPLTVRLVNWADEEGARFGRSLFGSSAAAGSMRDQEELRARRDADGVGLPEALRAHGVELDCALDARGQLENAAATWSCTSSRARCSNPRTPAGRRARHLRRRAPRGHVPGTGRARRVDADGQAAGRARRRGEIDRRSARSRRKRRGRGVHDGRVSTGRASSPAVVANPARPRPAPLAAGPARRSDARGRRRRERIAREEPRQSRGTDLADRAVPLPPGTRSSGLT